MTPAKAKAAPVKKALPKGSQPRKVGRVVESVTPVYYVGHPHPRELSVVWPGTGPDMPPSYTEDRLWFCPDCSTENGGTHSPNCPRNPNAVWEISAAWQHVRAKEQCFFGAGHPIRDDVDSYMTRERQAQLVERNYVVLYDYDVIQAGRVRGKTVLPARAENRSVMQQRDGHGQWKDEDKLPF